jgi:hypothetical protein
MSASLRASARAAGMKRLQSKDFIVDEACVEACPSLSMLKGAVWFYFRTALGTCERPPSTWPIQQQQTPPPVESGWRLHTPREGRAVEERTPWLQWAGDCLKRPLPSGDSALAAVHNKQTQVRHLDLNRETSYGNHPGFFNPLKIKIVKPGFSTSPGSP